MMYTAFAGWVDKYPNWGIDQFRVVRCAPKPMKHPLAAIAIASLALTNNPADSHEWPSTGTWVFDPADPMVISVEDWEPDYSYCHNVSVSGSMFRAGTSLGNELEEHIPPASTAVQPLSEGDCLLMSPLHHLGGIVGDIRIDDRPFDVQMLVAGNAFVLTAYPETRYGYYRGAGVIEMGGVSISDSANNLTKFTAATPGDYTFVFHGGGDFWDCPNPYSHDGCYG